MKDYNDLIAELRARHLESTETSLERAVDEEATARDDYMRRLERTRRTDRRHRVNLAGAREVAVEMVTQYLTGLSLTPEAVLHCRPLRAVCWAVARRLLEARREGGK